VFSTDDTIVAAATPPGRAGLGVVRIGGPQAVPIASVLAPGPAMVAVLTTMLGPKFSLSLSLKDNGLAASGFVTATS